MIRAAQTAYRPWFGGTPRGNAGAGIRFRTPDAINFGLTLASAITTLQSAPF